MEVKLDPEEWTRPKVRPPYFGHVLTVFLPTPGAFRRDAGLDGAPTMVRPVRHNLGAYGMLNLHHFKGDAHEQTTIYRQTDSRFNPEPQRFQRYKVNIDAD